TAGLVTNPISRAFRSSASRCGLARSASASIVAASRSRASSISFLMASGSRSATVTLHAVHVAVWCASPAWCRDAILPNYPRSAGARRRHRSDEKGFSVAQTQRLEVGDPAPPFSLPDADGNTVSLADYRGRKLIVYFYPAASTPGCTKQACDFRDNLAELNEAGLDVVGISPDKPEKLAKFRDAQGLTFPLLSDPDREVLTAWGAFGEKKMYGKTVQGVIRSTFVVDEDGKIALAQYNVRATGHV